MAYSHQLAERHVRRQDPAVRLRDVADRTRDGPSLGRIRLGQGGTVRRFRSARRTGREACRRRWHSRISGPLKRRRWAAASGRTTRRHIHAARRRLLRTRDWLVVPRPLPNGSDRARPRCPTSSFYETSCRGTRRERPSDLKGRSHQGDDPGRDRGRRTSRCPTSITRRRSSIPEWWSSSNTARRRAESCSNGRKGIRLRWMDYWATTTGHRSTMTTNPR